MFIGEHPRAAVVLALHLECQYQLLIVRRRLLRKKLRKGDPNFLSLWLEKLLVKVYHHHHQPVAHQPLICHVFSTPGAAELVHLPVTG